MDEMKVEWVGEHDFFESERAWVNRPHDVKMVPVVRLAAVDRLLAEAVWAMELIWEQASMFSEYTAKQMTDRSQAFLSRPTVAAWRARQEEEFVPRKNWNCEGDFDVSKP